jgi:murein DD-endopeptidase MepM/ murein hydrolase activator NlpD
MDLRQFIDEKLELDLARIEDKDLARDIQSNLKRIGYPLAIDGDIGPATEKAWAHFKKQFYLDRPEQIGASSARFLLDAPSVTTPFVSPTKGIGWVSSSFGPRSGGFHKGADVACNEGTPIVAVAAGVISHLTDGCRVGNFRCGGGYGNCVYIDHKGLAFSQTRYAHLSRLAAGLRIGDRISAGQTIGYCGNTGHSFGPHLHFETRVNGEAKNPINFINPLV